MTGTWKVDGDVQGTPVGMICRLIDSERRVTGTCTGSGDDRTARALTGAVTDKGLDWRFDSEYRGLPITVSMNATMSAEGTRMNGTMAVAPLQVEGTFVGARQ